MKTDANKLDELLKEFATYPSWSKLGLKNIPTKRYDMFIKDLLAVNKDFESAEQLEAYVMNNMDLTKYVDSEGIEADATDEFVMKIKEGDILVLPENIEFAFEVKKDDKDLVIDWDGPIKIIEENDKIFVTHDGKKTEMKKQENASIKSDATDEFVDDNTEKKNEIMKDVSEEDLKTGIDIEKEHKSTIQKIQEYLDINGKLPPMEWIYEWISLDHIEEHKKYYNDKAGLPEMEKNLKEAEEKITQAIKASIEASIKIKEAELLKIDSKNHNLVFAKKVEIKELKIMLNGRLIQKVNSKSGKREWALVSKEDNSKVLKYFGAEKPSKERVKKEEKRINYFKNKASLKAFRITLMTEEEANGVLDVYWNQETKQIEEVKTFNDPDEKPLITNTPFEELDSDNPWDDRILHVMLDKELIDEEFNIKADDEDDAIELEKLYRLQKELEMDGDPEKELPAILDRIKELETILQASIKADKDEHIIAWDERILDKLFEQGIIDDMSKLKAEEKYKSKSVQHYTKHKSVTEDNFNPYKLQDGGFSTKVIFWNRWRILTFVDNIIQSFYDGKKTEAYHKLRDTFLAKVFDMTEKIYEDNWKIFEKEFDKKGQRFKFEVSHDTNEGLKLFIKDKNIVKTILDKMNSEANTTVKSIVEKYKYELSKLGVEGKLKADLPVHKIDEENTANDIKYLYEIEIKKGNTSSKFYVVIYTSGKEAKDSENRLNEWLEEHYPEEVKNKSEALGKLIEGPLSIGTDFETIKAMQKITFDKFKEIVLSKYDITEEQLKESYDGWGTYESYADETIRPNTLLEYIERAPESENWKIKASEDLVPGQIYDIETLQSQGYNIGSETAKNVVIWEPDGDGWYAEKQVDGTFKIIKQYHEADIDTPREQLYSYLIEKIKAAYKTKDVEIINCNTTEVEVTIDGIPTEVPHLMLGADTEEKVKAFFDIKAEKAKFAKTKDGWVVRIIKKADLDKCEVKYVDGPQINKTTIINEDELTPIEAQMNIQLEKQFSDMIKSLDSEVEKIRSQVIDMGSDTARIILSEYSSIKKDILSLNDKKNSIIEKVKRMIENFELYSRNNKKF